MKILSLGASTSSTSINRQLANYAANQAAEQLADGQVTDLSLRDFDLPIYSGDEEKQNGAPAAAARFMQLIAEHDAVVISLAEHNGSYAAAFKNLYDWASRIDQKVWQDKPMLLLSTSPGGRGGATVLDAGIATFPRMGAKLTASFSLPGFYDHFSSEGINDAALASELKAAVDALVKGLAAN